MHLSKQGKSVYLKNPGFWYNEKQDQIYFDAGGRLTTFKRRKGSKRCHVHAFITFGQLLKEMGAPHPDI